MSAKRVDAVDRALSILEAFRSGHSQLSLKAIAEHTGLYKSTILRLCGSLEAFGYLHRDADGSFRLGPTLYQLGTIYQRAFNLEDYVRPVLRELVDLTHETASLYIRDKHERVCLFRENSRHSIRYHVEEGSRLPLELGAAGRILLAFSGTPGKEHDQVRKRGYYVSLGERDPLAAAVSAPVLGRGGRCEGALSVSGLRPRFTEDLIEILEKLVVDKARELSASIGGAPLRNRA